MFSPNQITGSRCFHWCPHCWTVGFLTGWGFSSAVRAFLKDPNQQVKEYQVGQFVSLLQLDLHRGASFSLQLFKWNKLATYIWNMYYICIKINWKRHACHIHSSTSFNW